MALSPNILCRPTGRGLSKSTERSGALCELSGPSCALVALRRRGGSTTSRLPVAAARCTTGDTVESGGLGAAGDPVRCSAEVGSTTGDATRCITPDCGVVGVACSAACGRACNIRVVSLEPCGVASPAGALRPTAVDAQVTSLPLSGVDAQATSLWPSDGSSQVTSLWLAGWWGYLSLAGESPQLSQGPGVSSASTCTSGNVWVDRSGRGRAETTDGPVARQALWGFGAQVLRRRRGRRDAPRPLAGAGPRRPGGIAQ